MEFLNPNVFYVLIIPLVVLFIVLITFKSGIRKHFSKEILEQISVNSTYLSTTSRNILYFIVLILFIVALSRPVLNEKEHNVKQKLIPIVIALDVSTSMLSADIYPNRISLAKKKLQNIIEKSKNSTIGVVLFAKDSFILSPVTEDFLSLKYIVDNLDTNLNFTNGSNIFATLDATRYMLEEFKVKNLIILSDGGNSNEYTDELEFAKENDIVIYSIGIATKEGAPIPKKDGYLTNENGDIVTVKLNESIKNLSLRSGGGYIEYSLDDNDVESIINRINIQSEKEELSSQKIKTYTELFYYPLAVGLFFLLLALSSFPQFRNKSKVHSLVFALLIISFFAPTVSIAYTFNYENIENAKTAYENKEYDKSSEYYRKISANNESFYNLANSLYKEGKYDDAIKMYNKVVTTNKELEYKKLHNLGNSYVNKNNLEKAKELYEKALKIYEDKETKENLEIVNKELEKQKKKEEKNNKKDQKKKEEKNNKKDQKNQDDKKDKDDKKQSKDSQDDKKNQDNKSKDSKDKKEQDQKNQENKKDDKKNSEKKKQTKEDEKSKKNKEQSNEKNKIDKDEISQMEEKKWMRLLKNQKTPIYLQEVNTNKESSYDEKQPW